MNRIMACGRLSADPQVKESRSGNRYARFCMASPRSRRDPAGLAAYNLFDCWCFSPRIVQAISASLRKGAHVLIAGELEIERHTDASGRDSWRPRLIVQELTMVDNGDAIPAAWAGGVPASPVSQMANLDHGRPSPE